MNERHVGYVTVIVFSVMVSLSAASSAMGQQPPKDLSPADRETLARILNDQELWGKDFPIVLAHLGNWMQIDESTVAVFRDQIVSQTSYQNQTAAERMSGELRQAWGKPLPQVNALFSDAVKVAPDDVLTLETELVPHFQDDGSTRIAWTAPSLELLPPDLAMATVRERVGKEEKVTQEVIQGETDSRPVVLTLHHYAGGAVTFVESDWSPKPGAVNRVLLNVPAVTTAVFEEPNP